MIKQADVPKRTRQIVLIVSVLAVVAIADQVTKAVVMETIEAGSITVWDKVEENRLFWFTHERNPGVVGGAFRDVPLVAMGLGLFATCVLLYLFKFLNPVSRFQAVAYGMVAGGAIGNMIDRFVHGSVTDFLQFNLYFIPFDFPWKLWPAFNVADACITTGIFALIIAWHRMEQEQQSDVPNSV